MSIPKISRSCRASAGVVLGTFPSVTHLYISCSSSRKGSSYVRRMVDSRYDPSGRVSLTIIVVGRPLTNGVSMHTLTVFVSPKTSIDASNRATWSTPDSYATAKLGYWNIALSWSVGLSRFGIGHKILPPEWRASSGTGRESYDTLWHAQNLPHGAQIV